MIKTIVFNGGLGNQMFQYAFYLYLKKRNPLDLFVFDIEPARTCHNGIEIDKIFNITIKNKVFLYRILYKFKAVQQFNKITQSDSLLFDDTIIKETHPFSIYDGFWQSEKYFKSVEHRVRKAFAFNEELLNNSTKRLSESLKKENYISVHIRRGDYVVQKDDFGLCDQDYYIKAIDYLNQTSKKIKLVFFSDDIKWVKDNLYYNDSIYVDWNTNYDSWQDMYLMSLCKHNIIANSSFSWWGAWLNNNPNKIVIAPKQWFPNRNNYDILPINWIKM